ncbi:MAG: hypothetical protein ABEK36_04360 [Candidatus Aenigmatarchaeota archaeon]
MGFGEQMQTDFNNVIDRYGTYVTHYSGASTLGSYYDDATITWTETGSFKVIITPNKSEELDIREWGERIEGNFSLFMKSGNSVSIKDKISLNSVNYEIIDIEDWEQNDVMVYRKLTVDKMSDD